MGMFSPHMYLYLVGADINSRDDVGKTPLELAEEGDQHTYAAARESCGFVVQYLARVARKRKTPTDEPK